VFFSAAKRTYQQEAVPPIEDNCYNALSIVNPIDIWNDFDNDREKIIIS